MYLIRVISDYLNLSISVLLITKLTKHTKYVTEKWTVRIYVIL